MNLFRAFGLGWGTIVFVLIAPLPGASVTVSSLADLQTAINRAQAGDELILANGTYLNNTLTVTRSNITIRAATPGGVFLNGTNAINMRANSVTFSGFQFTSGSIPGIVIEVWGSDNTLAQLNFDSYSAQKYIAIKAGTQRNAVRNANFQNKPATAPIGNLVHVDADPNITGYHIISRNSFQHMPGSGGDNGNECIRLGQGAQSTFASGTVVEYNYFEDTGLGDSEAISVKSRHNVLRWNTMNRNPRAMMVFRNGDDNVAYGNFFIDSGGIRVKEANNIYCYNNYFERAGIGGNTNAVTYDFVSPNLRNVNFFHNTFVESGLIALGSGATGNTWANNLFQKSSGSLFSGSSAGITWTGNLHSGALGISIPAGTTATADLGLTRNADGYSGLSATSPAVNRGAPLPDPFHPPGIEGDAVLGLDIAGQVRDSRKDVGCGEYAATGPVTNRPLSLADVGPAYLQSVVKVLNAASAQEGAMAPESIVSLFGRGLAAATETADGATVTALGGATVKVIDSQGVSRLAPLLFVSEGQINFLVPAATAIGPAVIVAAKAGGSPQNGSATVSLGAPGLFTVRGDSPVPAAFYLRVTAANQRISDYVFDPRTLAAIDIPRAAGDQTYLLLYGTGVRHSPRVTAIVTANGQALPVLAAVPQGEYAGLDQINVGPLPPNLPSGPLTIRLFDEDRPSNAIAVRLQ